MTRYLSMFLICLAPLCIALAHDVYLYVENMEKGFRFSAMGYIWTQYWPEGYRAVMAELSPEVAQQVRAFLTNKLTVVCLIIGLGLPLLIACEYFFLRLVFGWIGPGRGMFASRKARKAEIDFLKKDKGSSAYKYKRK